MPKIPVKPRELAPEGTHNAICFLVADLGTQTSSYDGKESEQREIQIAFDLVDEKTKEGKNMCVYKKVTYSGSPKANLTKIIKTWFNKEAKDFDMASALGAPAMITIAHSEKGYANIVSIAAPPKGVKVKKSTEPQISFFLDEFDASEYNELPEWLKGKIADSPEYLEASAPKKKTPAKKAKR